MKDSFSSLNFSQVTEDATLGVLRSQNWIPFKAGEESSFGGSFSNIKLGVDLI